MFLCDVHVSQGDTCMAGEILWEDSHRAEILEELVVLERAGWQRAHVRVLVARMRDRNRESDTGMNMSMHTVIEMNCGGEGEGIAVSVVVLESFLPWSLPVCKVRIRIFPSFPASMEILHCVRLHTYLVHE